MRRDDDIQRKLAPPPAPPAPAALLDAIKREIPDPLPSRPRRAARLGPLAWGTIAASLLVMLASRELLTSEPARAPRAPRPPRNARPDGVAKAPEPPATEAPAPAAEVEPAPEPAPEVVELPRAAEPPSPSVATRPVPAGAPTGGPMTAAEGARLRAERAAELAKLRRSPDPASPFDGRWASAPGGAPPAPGVEVAVPPLPPGPRTADPQSTFALDVGAESYGLIRRSLLDDRLPSPGDVRVAEVVNAFDYQDRAPEHDDFAVMVEGATSPFVRPRNREAHVVRIGVKAREIDGPAPHGATITLLVETSDRMARDRMLGSLAKIVGQLIPGLRDDDRIALVAFGSDARLVLPHTSDRDAILAAVRELVPTGAPDLERGLQLAYDTAASSYWADGVNRIVLVTSGDSELELSRPEEVLEKVRSEASYGIELSSLALGKTHDSRLRRLLARTGGGHHVAADSPDAALRLLEQELVTARGLVAIDARIRVEWSPETVASYRLLGSDVPAVPGGAPADDGGNAVEVRSGHAVSALYEVVLQEQAHGRLATITIGYRRPPGGPLVEHVTEVTDSEVRPSWDAARGSLRLAAIAAELAELLRKPPREGRGAMGGASNLYLEARDLAREAPREPPIEELADLVERAWRLLRSS